jgi:hypothetical protein
VVLINKWKNIDIYRDRLICSIKTLSLNVFLVEILKIQNETKSERKLLDDIMTKENIELGLNTIIVVDRCTTL